jgi:hypothetical protein
MKQLSYILILVLGMMSVSMKTVSPVYEDFCGLRNSAFLPNERLTFSVYYSVASLYVNAGTANFYTSLENLNGRPVYHVIGDGKTNSSYDWIYTVRDRYETFIDTASLQPLKFIRNISEGGYKKYENVTFNHRANTAVTNNGVFKVPDCVQDVISSLYYARNIDFNRYKPGDRIPFKMFLDNEVYSMYIRYMGKEDVKTKYGKFRAIKFKPLLVKGNIFEGGEKMTVWVSDDANHIPVRMESPIVVGSVKIDMMGYKGLRYPLSSLKKMKD